MVRCKHIRELRTSQSIMSRKSDQSIHKKNNCLLSVILFFFSGFSFAAVNSQQQLNQIKNSISTQEKVVAQQKKERSILQQELEVQEKSIANTSKRLKESETQLGELNKEMLSLSKTVTQLEKQQQEQKNILAKQLESAFRLGKNSEIELIFSNEQSGRDERVITYFSYINEARQEVITELKSIQQQLEKNRVQLNQKIKQQAQVVDQVKSEQKNLSIHKSEREKVLKSLNASLSKNEQRLAELKKNQAALQAKIAKAEREAKARAEREAREAAAIKKKQQDSAYKPSAEEQALMSRVGGLGKPKNQYGWPVRGSILNSYGSLLQGELRWKGMVIGAKEGTEVKAIANGRVLLASWLQGYGFLVAIEHGKNDMTIYGFNQRVLVNVNDNVKAGQPVALVGNSGGQSRSSLYFEIRRNGQTLNPRGWLTK